MEDPRVNFYKAVGGWLSMSMLDLERAYRDTLIGTHPDAHSDSTPEELDNYEKQFARATEAWSIIGDRRKRSGYNRLLYILGRECPTCKNTGSVKQRVKSDKRFKPVYVTKMLPCPECEGAGYLLTSKTLPEQQALNTL